MRIRIVLCAMAGVIVLSDGAAFATPARVMLEGAYGRWIPANIVILGTDTVAVLDRSPARSDTLPVRAAGIAEVYRGRDITGRHVAGHIFGGAVVGSLAAIIVFQVQNGGCRECGLGVIGAIGYGAAIGGGAGLLFGAIPAKTWTRVHVSPGARRWLDSHRAWP